MKTINVYCDFDGTITRQDTTDAVLEAFADPEYRLWERKWEEGSITAFECMERQTRLIHAAPEALRSFLSHLSIDPGIHTLKRRCAENGAALVIVSDGIDFLMNEILRAAGLSDLPHFSNRLQWDAENRPYLSFPYRQADCEGGCGLCKCTFLSQEGPEKVLNVFIGDGLSDQCVVHRAGRVFAKKKLQEYCLKENISYEPFDTLIEVADALFPESKRLA